MKQCEPAHEWVLETTRKGYVYMICENCTYRTFLGSRFTLWQRLRRGVRKIFGGLE